MLSNKLDYGFELNPALNSDALQVEFAQVQARYSLRAALSDVKIIENKTKLIFPKKVMESKISRSISIACLGPDEWFLTSRNTNDFHETGLLALGDDVTMSLVDITHRNIGFQLSGSSVENFINIGCPLDVSLSAFPIGKATRSVFEDASIVLMRHGETEFSIEMWRSFAPYFYEFFVRSIRQTEKVG